MRPRAFLTIGKFWFDIGWFFGINFKFFDFCLFEKISGMTLVFFSLQIAKFEISFGRNI